MSSFARLVSVSGFFDPALKSAAILLLAAIGAGAFCRAAAAWRHLVWCLSVVCLLLLPALSLVLPRWQVAWLPRWAAESPRSAITEQADHAPTKGAAPVNDGAIVSPPTWKAVPRAAASDLRSASIATIEPPRSAISWPTFIWSAGGLLSLVPLAIGLWQLARLHSRSQIIADPRWLDLLGELRRQLGVRRGVYLRKCKSVLAPLTWGLFRPVVFVPSEADDWPDERRRLVLLHELAHVRRWDWVTQLAAHVVCAMYWYNPFVWLAVRQMRVERERACDDAVLASGARPSDYARELIALAMRLSNSRMPALAAVPMARRGTLNDRLHSILDRRRSRAALTKVFIFGGAVLAAATVVPLAMLRAADPEVPESASAEPMESPPIPPRTPSVPAAREMEKVVEQAPVAIGNREMNELWDLTMDEILQIALANSKTLRNMGGIVLRPVVSPSEIDNSSNHDETGLVKNPKDTRGAKVRFILARTRQDVLPATFKAGVRNVVSDVERAYWELYYHYRNLNAVQAARDNSLTTWRKVHALFEQGNKKGEAQNEAQAREQYFLFRAQVENALALLDTAESRLRYLMGAAPGDGRLIRPADEPISAEVHFDGNEALAQTLGRRPEMPQDMELESVRMLTSAIRDLDRNYQVSRTTFNRRVAAAKQLEAVKATYEMGAATLDMLLDAQRRLADAEIAYYRALVDYNVAIVQVHFRKGSLLQHSGILLAEGALEAASPIDPFRPRVPNGD